MAPLAQPIAQRQRRRSRVGSGALVHFASLAPARPSRVDKIPNELLEQIFLLAQHPSRNVGAVAMQLACAEPLFPWPRSSTAQARSAIALVCKHWHDLLISSPRLWQQIEVSLNTNPSSLTAVAARSKSMPLFLRFLFHDGARPWTSAQDLSLTRAEQCELLELSLGIFAEASTRWSTLTVVAQEPVVIHRLFNFLHSDVSLPNLIRFETLYTGLHLYPPTYERVRPFPPPNGLPALTALVLRGSRVDWQALPMLLRDRVISLTIEHVYNRIGIAQFVEVLSSASRVDDLRIGGGFIRLDDGLESVDDSTIRAVMPSLRTLSLGEVTSDVIAVLISHLEMPCLRILDCDMPYTDLPRGHPDQMMVRDALSSGQLHFNPASLN